MKMNKIKQGLAFGLAGVMMSGMLGGCSSTGESSEASAPDTQEEAVELTGFAAASLTGEPTGNAEQD